MKKIGLLLIIIFCISGCGMKTAKEQVTDYLEQYKSLDNQVIEELNNMIENENLNDEQKAKYKEILKKEYSSLEYNVVSEKYTDEYAYIDTEVTVLDLYKAQSEALSYFNDHKDEFYDETGLYNRAKFMDYKLDNMLNTEHKITYPIEFKLIKDNSSWKVLQLSNDDLEKIHGIYSYEG